MLYLITRGQSVKARPSLKRFKGVFKMTITKDTVIGNILDEAPDTAPFFLEMGMHCLGCPASRGETVEQACRVHGVNADELVARINEFLNK